jgi:hypothetical protein
MSYAYTYAILEVSDAAYEEIKNRLEIAGYQHTFNQDHEHGIVIDLHGLALAKQKGDSMAKKDAKDKEKGTKKTAKDKEKSGKSK